jgi:hypothetical protein
MFFKGNWIRNDLPEKKITPETIAVRVTRLSAGVLIQ